MPESTATHLMTKLSLTANVATLIPVCTVLALRVDRVDRVYGGSTQARGILLSIYIAITLLSLALLARPDPRMISGLLLVQVLYKITTPFTIGTLLNAVVVSNLVVAVLHTVTLVLVFRAESDARPLAAGAKAESGADSPSFTAAPLAPGPQDRA